MAANVAAGLVGLVAFAAGHPYFNGNYESDVFDEVRENPAIAALPGGLPAVLEPAQRPVPDLRVPVEPAAAGARVQP